MTLFACSVPGKPQPQRRMRHTKSGRGYYPKESKQHRDTLVSYFRLVATVGQQWTNISQPCRVTIEVAGAHGGGDCDNHAKMVCDALVQAGVLAKDSLMVVRELVVRAVGGEPRTDVRIEAL